MEERTAPDLPVLIGQSGPLNGQRWAIGQPLTVGRDAACEVVITDRQVSRYHARLLPTEDGILLEDLSSKNGTFYNGKRLVDSVLLRDGDLVMIALVQSFLFLNSDATMPLLETATKRERPGRLYLDTRSRRVWIGQQEVIPPLSVPQFRLLQLLYERNGQVVPREELVMAVWQEQEAVGVSEQALDALVRRLRDRLALIDPAHAYLVTVRGHGLRLDIPPE